MRPYYADSLVTLYHGDCLELAEMFPSTGTLVTDPPYGYSYASNRENSRWRDEPIAGDGDTTARDVILSRWQGPAIVFGHWKTRRPHNVEAVLVWDKGMASGMGDLSMPWKPNWEEIYILGNGFEGRRDSGVISGHTVVTWASKGRHHPNEKPVGLMRDLLQKCGPGPIVDPFAGSGTTLRAAKDLGIEAIGIEIDECWCEVAAQRLGQEVLALWA